MRILRFISLATLLAVLLSSASISRAEEATKEKSAKKLQVLVLVGGHGFPEKPFHQLFENFPDMKCTFVEEKDGGEAFDNIDNWPYDVIVLYNHNRNPSEKRRENFLKLMDRGVGLVVLHHGLHGYKDWSEFKNIAGVTSFVVNSKDDVKYNIHIEDPKHPIVQGLKDFTVKDETYNGNHADPKVHVILTTDEPTNTKEIAWVHTYRKSPVCFLQLGHDTSIYGQKEFHTLLGNSIRWTAGKLPPTEK